MSQAVEKEMALPPTPKSKNIGVAWADSAVLAELNFSAHEILSILDKHGLPVPSLMAAYQWTSRGVIGSRWRPMIVYALQRDQRIKVGDLFRRAEAHDVHPRMKSAMARAKAKANPPV